MTEFAVLIVAAGQGTRAGEGIPKQYRPIGGKAVLRRTVQAFLCCQGLQKLHVVIHPDHGDLYQEAVGDLDIAEPVMGGATRQQSVAHGLKALHNIPDDMPVLIHDAARPFITRDIILKCVEELKDAKAVTVATPITDTIRKSAEGVFTATIDRENLWSVQTPQGFRYGVIKQAHETLPADTYTDDTGMVSAIGIEVKIIEGSRKNIKLTTEDDFDMFAPNRTITKTGTGYDVHAFGEASDKIRIGGVDIPHTKKLLGHSDADVVLHAITDAIFGTIGTGDIGSHFPPSDAAFKGMDSAFFLSAAIDELKEMGGEIVHIDTTVICEEPKIGPHREKIRQRIAEICDLPDADVSVKATTSEGLGFTGRREGIAAQALVTVEFAR